jgi:hypothetical protein
LTTAAACRRVGASGLPIGWILLMLASSVKRFMTITGR